MQELAENNTYNSKQRKSGWRRFRKIIFRTLVFFISAILLLSLSFIILSQSAGFRHWFYSYVLDIVNNELEGKIEADDIKISLFEGIKITNLRILAAGDTVAKVDHVSVKYSFSPLLRNQLYIKSIDLSNPRIKLIRNKYDSTWNFEHIAKPTDDTTPTKKLDWIFNIKNLSIINADIQIDDRTSQKRYDNRFDPLHSNLQNFNFIMRGKADLKKDYIFAEVKKLKFEESYSKFQLRQFGFEAEVTKQNIDIKNIVLNTNFFLSEIHAKAGNINIFDGLTSEEIEKSALAINIRIKDLNLRVLNKIDETFPEINDDIDFSAELMGNIDNIKANQISVVKNKSYLHLTGFLNKVTKPDETYFDLSVTNSNLFESDIKKIKSALDLDYVELEHTYIKRIDAKGNLNNLAVNFDIYSTSGNTSGNAQMNLSNIPRYNSNIVFSNLNIGKILNDESLISNLNGNLDISGQGTNPNDVNSKLKINLSKSDFQSYSVELMDMNVSLLPGKLVLIDTVNLILNNTYIDSTNLGLSKNSYLTASGKIDFKNERMPAYDFNLNLNEFNFASLLRTNLAPQYLDSKINISGRGFHPDSIETKMKAAINSCVFGDRALMPFGIDLDVERFSKTGRMILLSSDLFNLQLVGEYQLADFLQIADYQVKELVTFINKKVFTFYYNNADSLNYHFKHANRGPMKPFTMDLTGEIKDLTPIGIAVGQPNLSGKANIEMYIDVEPYHSIMDLRKLDVKTFQYKDGTANISINPTAITAKVQMSVTDSVPRFDEIALSIDGITESFINDMSFNKPKLKIDYLDDKMNLAISSELNRLIRLGAKGFMTFTDTTFKLLLDSAQIALSENYNWRSSEPVNVELTSYGLDIKRMVFRRDSSERISLSGKINLATADSVVLEVTDFPLHQAESFVPEEQKMYARNTKGKLQKLILVLNDSLSKPRINVEFNTNNVYFYNQYAGKFYGFMNYDNQNLVGSVILKDSTIKKEILDVKINSLPVDLALKSGGQRIIENKKIDLSINAYNAPLFLVNPFLPTVISNMSGFADARLDITGEKNNLDYIGYIDARNATFLSTVNNIYYSASGKITINNENITLNSIKVRNDYNDLENGEADVDGKLIFRYFNIENFDLNIKSRKGIKLVAMKSIKSMPDLYGDFIISSGSRPIHFYGTFTDPYIEGEVNILKAKLFMPMVETQSQIPKSRFKYVIKGKKLIVEDLERDSLIATILKNSVDSIETQVVKTKETEDKDFADILNYDLYVTFVGPMEINMEMPIGVVFAIVTTKTPNSPVHYYVNPKNNITRIIGDLVLKNNSTFKYVKLFNVTGEILFPTGDMNNPNLNLKAEYNGKSTIGGNIRNYTVNIYIQGSKNNPLLSFDYNIDGEPAKGDMTQIREDALFLTLFGFTKQEFESPTSSSKMSPIDDLGAASIAAVLSKSVTDMLSGTGFITNADIDLQGGSFQNAKLKLSGQIFGMTWNVGGTIADVMNGYEFTAEIPIGLLLLPNKLKSLFLLFTTSVNPTSYVSRNQKNWEVKIKFGGEF